jgi:hypothetical protein
MCIKMYQDQNLVVPTHAILRRSVGRRGYWYLTSLHIHSIRLHNSGQIISKTEAQSMGDLPFNSVLIPTLDGYRI